MKARLCAKLFIRELVLFLLKHMNENYNFQKENFALSLTFTITFKAIRKWPIYFSVCSIVPECLHVGVNLIKEHHSPWVFSTLKDLLVGLKAHIHPRCIARRGTVFIYENPPILF